MNREILASGLSALKGNGNIEHHTYEEVETIAKGILEKVKCRPQFGIICGSGLGGLADLVSNTEIIPYAEIPGFPVSTVPGHAGKLIFGDLEGKKVVLMQGRAHLYEGYAVQRITLPVRVMKLMGVSVLIVTNAAGGINPEYSVGDIMIIKDHFNVPGFAAVNPLIGPNDERFGPRFPAASGAYDKEFRELAKQKAKELGYDSFVREGVYSCLGGPSFETVTECRFLRLVGVDSTGMSTIPEVLVARHCGMRVLGLSLITNKCIVEHDSKAFANHEEVLETAKMRSKDLQALAAAIVQAMKI
ncbi:hypothetical protein ACJMK2_010442 [Sinanodonta woodiana]|uniref:Purine nucleoside phosphorylase n=1 Tax=Sinanodonta woodiana TaxID=1069815 RepID=A0ABD3VHT4_SINWO